MQYHNANCQSRHGQTIILWPNFKDTKLKMKEEKITLSLSSLMCDMDIRLCCPCPAASALFIDTANSSASSVFILAVSTINRCVSSAESEKNKTMGCPTRFKYKVCWVMFYGEIVRVCDIELSVICHVIRDGFSRLCTANSNLTNPVYPTESDSDYRLSCSVYCINASKI